MFHRVRCFLASIVLLPVVAPHAAAQTNIVDVVEEIRIDLAGLSTTNGTRLFGGIPGAIALGIYVSDAVALEPRASFEYVNPDVKPEGESGSLNLDFGVYAPVYFSGNRGRSGIFVAPGISITKRADTDATIDVGADIGYKVRSSDRLSWRVAAELRNFDQMELGGRFGLSIFWR
jgi:hypothetical protein